MAKAKISKPAATKKVSKPEAASVRPVKETLTKSALINLFAEQNDIPRRPPQGFATLENVFFGSAHPCGVGEFTLPGLLKVIFAKCRLKGRNSCPQSRHWRMVKAAAKPASVRVKIRHYRN